MAAAEGGAAKLRDSANRLRLNTEFTRKGVKFKIGAAVGLARAAEKTEAEVVSGTVQQVASPTMAVRTMMRVAMDLKDRRHFLECTIVRIMKTRKVLRHNDLIQEVGLHPPQKGSKWK